MTTPGINERKPRVWKYTYFNNNGTQNIELTDIWWYRTVVSETVKNPAAIAARRRGESVWLPPLPYYSLHSVDEIDYTTERLENDPSWVPNGYTAVGYADPGPPPSPILSNDANDLADQALKRAYDKLKQQNVNFAQFFVEGEQTAELIASTAGRLASGLRAIKKGNIVGALKAVGFGRNNRQRRKAADAVRRAARDLSRRAGNEILGPNAKAASKKAANEWLSMQFGWMPLLSDLDGAAKLMAERSTQDPKRSRFNVTARRQIDLAHRSRQYYANPSIYRRVCSYGLLLL